MLKKRTIFDFFANVLIIYSISIISISIFCFIFGENAEDVSTIFQLGNKGLSINTMFEFFILSIFISATKWLFFTDIIIKNLSLTIRTVCMFGIVIIIVGIFAAIFNWFPVTMPLPWIMFIVCFVICTAISIIITTLKEKTENQKMKEALERLKKESLQ